jgi:hypothetical protein
MSDGPWSVAFDFIDRFLNNYGIWLWLLVFFGLLWVAEWMGYVSFSTPLADIRNTSVISALLIFCFLLNSINAHVHISKFVHELTSVLFHLCGRIYRSLTRPKKQAKENFGKIISFNCRERNWLIWYIFEWEPNSRFEQFALVHSREEYFSYGTTRVGYFYNSLTAYFLSNTYKIFYTIPEGILEPLYPDSKEYAVRLYPTINLFEELEEVLNSNSHLRIEISDLVEKLKGKRVNDLNQLDRGLEWYREITGSGDAQTEYERRRKIANPQQPS